MMNNVVLCSMTTGPYKYDSQVALRGEFKSLVRVRSEKENPLLLTTGLNDFILTVAGQNWKRSKVYVWRVSLFGIITDCSSWISMLYSEYPLKPTLELIDIKVLLTDKDLFVRRKEISNAAVFNTDANQNTQGALTNIHMTKLDNSVDTDWVNLEFVELVRTGRKNQCISWDAKKHRCSAGREHLSKCVSPLPNPPHQM